MNRVALEFLLLLPLIVEGQRNVSEAELQDAAYLCDGIPISETVIVSRGGSGLDAFVGNNIVQELLYDPKCSLDSDCLSRYLSSIISSLIRAAAGIIAAGIFLVAFILFTPCFCSRRFRRWSGWKRIKEPDRATNFRSKNVVMTVIAFIIIAVLVDIGFVAKRKSDVNKGFNSAVCEVYRFMNETVNGGEAVAFDTNFNYTITAQFPGLYNATDLFSNLTDLIAPNSPLSKDLDTLMEQTGYIEGELVVLQQELMTLNYNMMANIMFLNHTCIFCSNFTDFPDPTSQYNPTNPSGLAANNSLAGALTFLRNQLKPLVDTTSSGSLYNTLNQISDVLTDYADRFTNVLIENVLDQVSLVRTIFKYIDIAVIVVLSITVVPLVLGVLVVVRGVYKSTQDDYKDPIRPPMSPAFVSASIWVTFIYTLLVFILSGAILIASYLLGSVCLVMEDVGSVAGKLSFRFGASPEINSAIIGTTQQCLRQNTDGDILSGIVISGQTTARDTIDAVAILATEFAAVQESVNAGTTNTNLSTNIYLKNLGQYIDQVGDLYVITEGTKQNFTAGYIPNPEALIFRTDYQKGLEVYDEVVFSVPDCPERDVLVSKTPPGVIAKLVNYTMDSENEKYMIQGLSYILEKLNSFGVSTGIDTCPADQTPPTENLDPWGNLVGLKTSFMENDMFQCSVPQITYDPVTQSYSVLDPAIIYCSQSELRTYMQNFGPKLINQAQKLDDVVNTYFNSIFDSIWSAIYEELMQPIQDLSASMNCQFISTRWNALFKAMCITLTPSFIQLGNTLFALGFAGVFILLLQIIVWRHLKDNYCLWQDAIKEEKMSPKNAETLSELWNTWGSELNPIKKLNEDADRSEESVFQSVESQTPNE